MSYGDKAHKMFLDEGWTWDGVAYAITYVSKSVSVELTLSPAENPHDTIHRIRMGRWNLKLHVGDIRIYLATFSDLRNASTCIMMCKLKFGISKRQL